MINPRMGNLLVEEIKENKKEQVGGFVMIDSTIKPRKGVVVALPLEGNPNLEEHLLVTKNQIVHFMRCVPIESFLLVNEADVLATESEIL